MDFIKMIMELPGEKRSQDVVEHTEWNSLWKLIVTQGNHSENYLEQLYDYFFNKEGWVHKVQAELDGVQPYLEGVMTQPVGKAPDGSLWTYPSTESGTVPWGNVMGDITRQQDLIDKFATKADTEHRHGINSLTFNTGDLDGSWIKNGTIIESAYGSKSIPTSALKDLSVTSEKLNNGAVTTAKIASGAIINDSIANYSVSGIKITNGAISQTFTVTIPAAGWTGEAAPYTNVVTVNGLLAADTPIADMIPSETYETAETEIEAYASIYKMVTADNQLTAYATEKPTVDISIQIKAVRK